MLPLLPALLATCLLAGAADAFADRGHGKHHRDRGHHEYRHEYRHAPRAVYVAPRRVYHVSPRPVYLGHPVHVVEHRYYAAPRRVVHHHHHGCGHDDDAWKWIGGSLLVGAILHEVYD